MQPMRAIWGWIWAGYLAAVSAQAQTNGIFADFATSMGTFTVALDFARAPRAVANFIGLATGGRPWMDPETGAVVSNDFYAGTRIHQIVKRVEGGVTNVVAVRGGRRPVRDPAGAATYSGGPGYAILQEITNGLSHSNGVIAMVNLGPHSAGSEYVLTVTNVPSWDGAYTVFGNVVSNMAVISNMAAVTVDPDTGTPLVPIAVSNVAVRRVGAAAEAFDIHAQSLPLPTQSLVHLDVANPTNSRLSYGVPAQSEFFVVHTTNLLNPARNIDSSGFNASAVPVGMTNVFWTAAFGPVHFFHASQVHYPVFTAIEPGSNFHFAATWSSGDTYHYFLDIPATTGTWGVVPAGSNAFAQTGNLTSIRWRTATANSTQFNFLIGWNDLYYTLGFGAPGVTNGRYYLEAYDVFSSGFLGDDRGAFWYGPSAPMLKASRDRFAPAISPGPSLRPAGWRPRRSDWRPDCVVHRESTIREPGLRFAPERRPP